MMRWMTLLAVGIAAMQPAGEASGQDAEKAPPVKPGGAAATRPGAASGAARDVDHVADLIDRYRQGGERDRFFKAAGVDGELSREEFAADAKRPDPFVRPYDRWPAAVAHDVNGNGKLDWTEAERYRLAVRKQVMDRFDKDKNGKLTGAERGAANTWLRRGLGATRRARGDRRNWDTDGDGKLSEDEQAARREHFRRLVEDRRRSYELRQYDKNRNGRLDEDEVAARDAARKDREERMAEYRRQYQERIKKYDADGDGKLDREERAAMIKAMRDQWQAKRLAKWDADGDGKLSESETQAEREQWRKDAEERRRQWMIRRHDKNRDGTLDETEQAAMEAEQEKWRKMRESARERMKKWRAQWDTDGNGEISDAERKAMREALRARWAERRKEMDADGDGKVSREEALEYYRKRREKYDADGDGKLNQEEREKMYEEQGHDGGGHSVQVLSADGGTAIRTGPNTTTVVTDRGSVTVTVGGGDEPGTD